MQGIHAVAASSSSGGFNPTTLIFIVLIVVVFYMLMIRPQQRRKQQAQQQANTLEPGAEVVTTAGMYATVTAVDGDDVILEVAPGCEVRYMKRSIMNVVSPAPVADEDETPVTQPAEGVAETDDVPEAGTATGSQSVDEETEVADSTESAYEQATGTKKD
jgi:preprotein translocase subunit YajC